MSFFKDLGREVKSFIAEASGSATGTAVGHVVGAGVKTGPAATAAAGARPAATAAAGVGIGAAIVRFLSNKWTLEKKRSVVAWARLELRKQTRVDEKRTRVLAADGEPGVLQETTEVFGPPTKFDEWLDRATAENQEDAVVDALCLLIPDELPTERPEQIRQDFLVILRDALKLPSYEEFRSWIATLERDFVRQWLRKWDGEASVGLKKFREWLNQRGIRR